MFFILLLAFISLTSYESNAQPSNIQGVQGKKEVQKQVLPDPTELEHKSFFIDIAQKLKSAFESNTDIPAETQPTAAEKEDPAAKMPDPLFSEAIYGKSKTSITHLYLFNDKNSSENGYIPEVVGANQILPNLFRLSKQNYDFADFRLLFEGISRKHNINPNTQDAFGNTVLHYTIRNNNVNAFNVLIDSGKIDPNICNYSHICPIHLAIFSSNLFFLKKLLNNGANIRMTNDRFEFPIVTAILMDNTAAVDILAQYYKGNILDSEIDYIMWIAEEHDRKDLGQRFYNIIFDIKS